MSLCLIYVFLCQSYLFDEDVPWMKRGVPEGILLLRIMFEGFFKKKQKQVHSCSPTGGCSLCYVLALLELLSASREIDTE